MTKNNDRNRNDEHERNTNDTADVGEAVGTMGGGVVGAAVGTVLGGPLGTVVGGIVGGALGNKMGEATDDDEDTTIQAE